VCEWISGNSSLYNPKYAIFFGHLLVMLVQLSMANCTNAVPSNNVNHCLDFSFVFSAPLLAWRNLFSASRIFCDGRYQPGCAGIFWPVEGTSQPVTIFKKWKNPSSALHRKGTWVQAALQWFSTCSFGLLASGTDLKSLKGMYSGPSPIHITHINVNWAKGWASHAKKQDGDVWMDQAKQARSHKQIMNPSEETLRPMCKLIREHKETSTNRERIWENFGDLIGNIAIILYTTLCSLRWDAALIFKAIQN